MLALRSLAPECSGQIVQHRGKQLAISRVSVLHERDDSTRELQGLRARRGDTVRIDGVHEETNQILFRKGVHRSPQAFGYRLDRHRRPSRLWKSGAWRVSGQAAT